MSQLAAAAINWTEQGYIPDTVVRYGIRRLLAGRLKTIHLDDCEALTEHQQAFIEAMHDAPIALLPEKANEQHYEVPSAFFGQVLGPQRKYSCCYWPQGVTNLADAETAALQQTSEHARLQDGQQVLELGCGWGSLTLWMARQYPHSHITAVSNSASQREYIEQQAAQQDLTNLTVITCDMNDFHTEQSFDRVVSVEMFEHMRNWGALYQRISQWLKPDGLFFKHIFIHRSTPYLFEDRDTSDWMSRHFFSGGMMPGADLPLHFQHDLQFVRRWHWQGQHYEKTCNAWLAEMDRKRDAVWPLLSEVYGTEQTQTWWMRWRIFFMACAELFAYNRGQEWFVGHYLFRNR